MKEGRMGLLKLHLKAMCWHLPPAERDEGQIVRTTFHHNLLPLQSGSSHFYYLYPHGKCPSPGTHPLAFTPPPVMQKSWQCRREPILKGWRVCNSSPAKGKYKVFRKMSSGRGQRNHDTWNLTIPNITYISVSDRPNDLCYILCSDQFQTLKAGFTCSDEFSVTQVSLRTEKNPIVSQLQTRCACRGNYFSWNLKWVLLLFSLQSLAKRSE